VANNFTPANPYTRKVPTGTLNHVQLTNPTTVKIAWPNPSGGNAPIKQPIGISFLRKLFG
jgi:hypothetical protein